MQIREIRGVSCLHYVPIPGTRAGLPVYIPPPPLKVVARTRLIEQLNERVRVSAGGTPGVTLISLEPK